MIFARTKLLYPLGLILFLITSSIHSQTKTYSIAFGSCDNPSLKRSGASLAVPKKSNNNC